MRDRSWLPPVRAKFKDSPRTRRPTHSRTFKWYSLPVSLPTEHSPDIARARGRRLAAAGLVLSLVLGTIKLVAGLVGNSFALVADAVESFTDILGSVIVWSGLLIAARPPSERHPYGYGRAETLAALVVALLVLAAGIGVGVEAVSQLVHPHHIPAWWTLLVLVVVITTKEVMYRVARRASIQGGSPAVEADAWHHRSDAITSLAAFIGISIAVIGGKGWETADDWAALFAAGVIVFNGSRLLVGPVRELLDAQRGDLAAAAAAAAERVPGVIHVQKSMARSSGSEAWVDMHVWVDGSMSVRDAHQLAHQVKEAVRKELPSVRDVLVHVEPAASPPAAATI